jgi:DNA processing protein
MADAIVVVQGRARSGALLTAREGFALGRPVGAVPWDCRDPLGEAPHALIRAGRATLVRHAGDILDLLHPPTRAARGGAGAREDGDPLRPAPEEADLGADARLDPAEAALLAALRRHPQPLDHAAARAGLPAATAAAALVTLELRGLAESGPGGLVRRARRGP